MRVLITASPLMYRESFALTVQHHRPDYEVMIAPTVSLARQTESFKPHLLIRDETDGADTKSTKSVPCWIEILYSDGMDARISLDGEVWVIKNILTEAMMRMINRLEEMLPDEPAQTV